MSNYESQPTDQTDQAMTAKQKLGLAAGSLAAAGALIAGVNSLPSERPVETAHVADAPKDVDTTPMTNETVIKVTTTEAPAPTTTTQVPETTTTTEAVKADWQLAAEKMANRKVGDHINFIHVNLRINPGTKLFSGPHQEAESWVYDGEQPLFVANPDAYKAEGTSGQGFICFNSFEDKLICSNDFQNMKSVNMQTAEEKPFNPSEAGITSKLIDYVDQNGFAYVEYEESFENQTENGMRIGQQVDSFSAVGQGPQSIRPNQ